MQKYPDKIIILEVHGGNPFESASFQVVYQGVCRCFLNKPAALRTTKVMDCDYGVVIPDRSMIDIGENFKVGIKFHNSKSNKSWDLVGYVKDFARYDRVCNLYFQMVKQNLIAEDMPEGISEEDWPIIKGMDMQYVSFYMADGLETLPYWAYNGDWSNETDMSNKFNGCSSLTAANVSTAVNATTFESCFEGCLELTSILMPSDWSHLDRYGLIKTFMNTKITEMYVPSNQCLNLVMTFSGCTMLEKVVFESFTPQDPESSTSCVWDRTFVGCTSLEKLSIEGVLGGSVNDFTNTGLEYCPLTQESIHDIIMALYDNPTQDGQSNVFNFGQENVAKLTDSDNALLAQKGWIAT